MWAGPKSSRSGAGGQFALRSPLRLFGQQIRSGLSAGRASPFGQLWRDRGHESVSSGGTLAGKIGVTTEPLEEYSRIVERAIALARTGQFASPEAVRRQLNREGFSSASLCMRERALNSEIRALCSATNPSGRAARSFSGRRS
jgi:hypothetical protein